MAAFFASLNHTFTSLMGDVAALWVWGAIAGIASSALFVAFFPVARTRLIKQELRDLNKAMLRYDGDFSGLQAMVMRNLRLSGGLLGYGLLPCLLSVYAVLVIAAAIYPFYCCETPQTGQTIRYITTPEANLRLEPAQAQAGSQQFHWPASQEAVTFLDEQGKTVLRLPGAMPLPAIGKASWLDWILPSPNLHLNMDAAVERMDFSLAPRQFHASGPEWSRGWERPFFISLLVSSVLAYLAFMRLKQR